MINWKRSGQRPSRHLPLPAEVVLSSPLFLLLLILLVRSV